MPGTIAASRACGSGTNDPADAALGGGHHHRQHAGHRPQPAGEGELADEDGARERVARAPRRRRASTATAIARSKWVPRLGRSAGESRIVIRLVAGQSSSLLMIAIRQRSRASLSDGVGPADQRGADLAGRDVGLDVDEVAERAVERDRVGGRERHQASPRTWSTIGRPAARPEHGDQVDPHARSGRTPWSSRPAPRQPVQPVELGVGRPPRAGCRTRSLRAGLDLADDQHVAVAQHQVDLALGAPPVAVEQDHALLGRGAARRRASPYAPSACRWPRSSSSADLLRPA